MTIKEIAAMAGVSPAAVSLVMNNKKGVSAETRDRVKKVIDDAGYEPPQYNKKSTSCSIGFIKHSSHGMVVEENQGFIASIIDQIEQECRRFSYNLVMCGCNNDTIEDTFKLVSGNKFDGVILLGSEFSNANLNLMYRIKAPLVVLDNSMRFENVDSVVMANSEIASAAVRYLYGLGHRKIGYFHSSVQISNFAERGEGYFYAMEKLNLPAPRPISLTPTLTGAYNDMKKLLESGKYLPGGGVFADNDTIAIGAIKALTEAGYEIPRDISIIGVDDIPFSSMTMPTLTTMRVNRPMLGTLAVDTLRKRIKHPEWPYVHIQTTGQLVERGSTKRVDI